MKIYKNKFFRLAITVILIIAVPLGAYAVKKGIQPTVTSGGYYSKTVNRMDFSLDCTEFTFTKTDDGNETFVMTLNLSVKKCEPDFYAVLKNVNITGLDFNYTVFSADEQNGNDYAPENLQIKTDGELKWKIEISFDSEIKTTLTPELTVEYISGFTEETADEHILSIPLQINIE